MDRAQTTHEPIRSAGCTLLSFQRPLRLVGGTRRPSRTGQTGAWPRGTEKYSGTGPVCPVPSPPIEAARLGSAQAQTAEAPLAGLEDLSVELPGRHVEGLGGQRLAVELDAALLEQAPC